MSSAVNHARRSHRSERIKRSIIGASHRKRGFAAVEQEHRGGLFAMIVRAARLLGAGIGRNGKEKQRDGLLK